MATYPDTTPAGGLLSAFRLAAMLQAIVTPIVHEVDIPDVRSLLGNAMIDVPGMIAIAEQNSRIHADQLTEAAQAAANRFQMRIATRRWRGTLGQAPSHLATIARSFDQTFLVPAEGSWEHYDIAQGLLFGSGGPVWIFPAEESTGQLDTVAIAWDGGRAASRAVRDALPTLARAKHIIIISATDDKPTDELALQDVHRHLREHGLAVSTKLFSRGDRPIGSALQDEALDAGAGLLVMGAYGHSRLWEFALGGATKDVLSSRKLTILMSH